MFKHSHAYTRQSRPSLQPNWTRFCQADAVVFFLFFKLGIFSELRVSEILLDIRWATKENSKFNRDCLSKYQTLNSEWIRMLDYCFFIDSKFGIVRIPLKISHKRKSATKAIFLTSLAQNVFQLIILFELKLQGLHSLTKGSQLFFISYIHASGEQTTICTSKNRWSKIHWRWIDSGRMLRPCCSVVLNVASFCNVRRCTINARMDTGWFALTQSDSMGQTVCVYFYRTPWSLNNICT